MVSQNTLIKRAIQETKKSSHEVFRFGVVIFNKNKILSTGTNSIRAARNLHPRFFRWPGSVHAEAAAILNAKTDLSGSSMFIIRVNRVGDLMYARPCEHCLKYIKEVGIKKIIYSISNDEFGVKLL
ncbi:MAG: hypothetical protein WC503_02840 [Candidatus Shapirobacteria bacterium]